LGTASDKRDASHHGSRRDIEHFDRWAATYDRSWTQRIFFGPVHRGVVAVAAGLASDPLRVLDVGCGTGALLRAVAQRFPQAELVGVDASTEMIRMAEASNPSPDRLRFARAQAEELPFADGQFDLVLSTISFHHWADQGKGLHEVARALVPGGLFLLADHFVIRLQRFFFATPNRRERFHTPTEIGGMLRGAGFAQIEWHDIYRIGPLLLVAGVTARKA
jgi:ubiquinone/menaquinone biosynthesis C-methylase UbiE